MHRPLWQPLAAGAVLAGLTILVIAQARRRPYLAVGWLWYVGTLVPVIGLVQVGTQSMADRYTYVPLVGIFIMAAWAAADVAARWRRRWVVLVAAAAIVAALAVAARVQVGYWRNNDVLFQRDLEVVGNNAVVQFNLGASLMKQGRNSEAAAHFAEAIRLDPADMASYGGLGYILQKQGRYEEAVACYRQALQFDPNAATTHCNLGVVLESQGRREEALLHYREAIRLDPATSGARFNLAALLMSLGRADEAAACYREELSLNPGNLEASRNLGLALVQAGRPAEAIAFLEEAVGRDPGNAGARGGLGVALASAGRNEEAAIQLREAVRLDPGLAAAQMNLSLVLVAQGKTAQAATHLYEVMRLRPDWPDPPDQLARIRATDPDPAIRNGSEAVTLAARACALTGRRNPVYLDALAAAYAEAGRFLDAARTAREAAALAASQGNTGLAARAEAARQLYEAGRPLRRSP